MGPTRHLGWVAAALLVACSGSKSPPTATLTREQLLDPTSCAGCHAEHYEAWASSMHAHAADDPVFRAMNQRGQRETGGALGPFCVNCHAPMAVREGATRDGLNLDQVPQHLKGVTCFFCHSIDAVQGAHDDPLRLVTDGGLRGPIRDPIGSPHGSAYSPLLDRDRPDSATTCGACHDIVNGHGAAIERTFAEWQHTAFAQAQGGTTCGQCHMARSTGLRPVASVAGAPMRRVHGHDFAAVDVSFDAPDAGGQLALIKQFLDTTLQAAVCVEPLGAQAKIEVILDNVSAGHGFPSGSAQDRRAWVEVVASSDGGALYASGQLTDGGAITDSADPDLWLLRDCMVDANQRPVKMFWEASLAEGNELPGQATFDATDPAYYRSHVFWTYPTQGTLASMPDRVEMRVRLRPIGLDVLDDLSASGDLSPAIRAQMPTFDVGPTVVWTPQQVNASYVDRDTGSVVLCVSPGGLNVQADKVAGTRNSRCAP